MGVSNYGSNAAESRVLIIMTGGTICMQHSADGFIPARGFLETGLAPRPSFNDGSNPEPLDVVIEGGAKEAHRALKTPLSKYGRSIRYCVHEFETLLDSSSIDSIGWTQIASVIHRNYQYFDGFVILHGTDSLAYTCSALSFMLQDLGKPVILTGSQAPMSELQNDATDNLLGSLIVAGHFMIAEVCLFFNYNLFRGNRATKVSATEFAAFASPNHPPLATISATGTNVSWHLVQRPTQVRPLSLQTNLLTAHVACLRIFPGIRPEMVDAVLRVEGLKGLILETFGTGNAPGGPDSSMTNVLASAVQRGIVIVNVTQCLSGNVSPLYAPATMLGRRGVIFGYDMTTEAALTKLGYLLAQPDLSLEEVRRQMSISLRGELTNMSQTQFQHPDGPELTVKVATLTALAYAISDGNLESTKIMLGTKGDTVLRESDYMGDTLLHIAAASLNLEIVHELLLRGASVHIRNHAGHTPLYIAADAGRKDHVLALLEAGGHLHAQEVAVVLRDARKVEDELWLLVLKS